MAMKRARCFQQSVPLRPGDIRARVGDAIGHVALQRIEKIGGMT